MPSDRPPTSFPAPCHLVAIGATTGVGGTAAVSMAAVRAGLTRTERLSHGPGEDDWSHAVRVSTLASSNPEQRADALLGSALEQIAPALTTMESLRVHAWHSGPARFTPLVARHLRLRESLISGGTEHGAEGLLALESAWLAVREQRLDVAVVTAAYVGSDEDSLVLGRLEERVLGGTSSFGTVPGEAAVALVWASDEARQKLALPSLGRLLAVAHAEEATPFGGPKPCVGEGLVRAIRGVLAALPREGRVARVFCNLNGERERTDEWGFALPRLSDALAAPGAFVTPIGTFGDVEAASGLLLLGLASALSSREGAPAAPCLIWASSRVAARAAALFESPSSRWPRAAAAPAPRWAHALDDSMLAELADEASFRYEQRLFQYSGQAGIEPRNVRLVLTRVEGALDAAVQGLVDCGPGALQAAEEALRERPSPGALYAAARVAFEAGEPERGSSIIAEHLTSAPGSVLAVRLAIEHAPPLGKAAAPLVGAWLRGGLRLAALSLRLAAHNSLTPPLDAIRSAGEALSDDAVAEAADWLGALGRLNPPGALPLIARWKFSRHERLRRSWAKAASCLGGAEGREAVLARSEQDPAVILPAALCVEAARARRLRELASALSGIDACLSLGLLGDARAVPHLIECLADPSRAEAAAGALQLLLGNAPKVPRGEADAVDGKFPGSIPSSLLEADAWRELAKPILERHPSESRLRAGSVASAAITLELLERVHLPLRVRSYLARELSVRWELPQTIDVDGLLREQAAAIRAISLLPVARKVGGWD